MASYFITLGLLISSSCLAVNFLLECDTLSDDETEETHVCRIDTLTRYRKFDLCTDIKGLGPKITHLIVKEWRSTYTLTIGNQCPNLKEILLLPRKEANCDHLPPIVTNCLLTSRSSSSSPITSTSAESTPTITAESTMDSITLSTKDSKTPAVMTATNSKSTTNAEATTTSRPNTTASTSSNLWMYIGYSVVGIVLLLGLVGAVLIYRRTKGRSTDIELQMIGEETQVKTVHNPEYQPFDHELSRMETETLPPDQVTPTLSAIQAAKASISTIEDLFKFEPKSKFE